MPIQPPNRKKKTAKVKAVKVTDKSTDNINNINDVKENCNFSPSENSTNDDFLPDNDDLIYNVTTKQNKSNHLPVLSHEQAVEFGRLGGIASAKKRTQKAIVEKVLAKALTPDEVALMKSLGENPETIEDANEAIYTCGKYRAMRGDPRWAEILLKATDDYGNKTPTVQINNGVERMVNIFAQIDSVNKP